MPLLHAVYSLFDPSPNKLGTSSITNSKGVSRFPLKEIDRPCFAHRVPSRCCYSSSWQVTEIPDGRVTCSRSNVILPYHGLIYSPWNVYMYIWASNIAVSTFCSKVSVTRSKIDFPVHSKPPTVFIFIFVWCFILGFLENTDDSYYICVCLLSNSSL